MAILFVLIYHCASYEPVRHSMGWYLMLPRALMWSGVDLFFVLSGFLIGGILMDNRGGNRYFRAFYARRVYRIFPLYYGLLAIVCAGAVVWPASPLFASKMPMWAFVIFAQNIVCVWVFVLGSVWTGAMWSLAVEEQFYLLLPVIVRFLRRGIVTVFALTCIVGAPLLRTYLIAHGAVFTQVYPLLVCRADALAYGVLAATITRSEHAQLWIKQHKRLFYGAVGVTLAGALSTYKWAGLEWVGTAGYTFVDAFYFLLILTLLILRPVWLDQFLTLRVLIWLGQVSYGAYLLHGPVLGTLFEIVLNHKPMIHDRATFLLTVAGLAITLGLAQISWRWLESPLVKRAHSVHRYHVVQ